MAGRCLLTDYLDFASASLLERMHFVYVILRRLIVRQSLARLGSLSMYSLLSQFSTRVGRYDLVSKDLLFSHSLHYQVEGHRKSSG
jgi:hypothetical protein